MAGLAIAAIAAPAPAAVRNSRRFIANLPLACVRRLDPPTCGRAWATMFVWLAHRQKRCLGELPQAWIAPPVGAIACAPSTMRRTAAGLPPLAPRDRGAAG